MIDSTVSLDNWRRFVDNGVLDSSRLNKRIAESWYRSRDANVNPQLGKGRHILDMDLLHLQKEKNALLLDIALPHLERMKEAIKELGMISLLIDPEGYVLSQKGSREAIETAKKINFVEGVRWTEEEMGTNAIGTALQAREAITVTGKEHYSIASHQWSCSAAPIRNDDGHLLGIIDVSCPEDRAIPHMLGMVVSTAYTIERELSIRIHKDEVELINGSMDLIESAQPLLICNPYDTMICASKSIRLLASNWVGLKAEEVKSYGFTIQMEIPVYSKYHGGLIGKCVYLAERPVKESNPYHFPHTLIKPFYFKGEAGTSEAFGRTIEDVKRVAPSDASVYILGETGTGKEMIAQTIHENSQRKNAPFIAVNCGAIPKELMESELFGYVDGAFTGARRQGYKGKFEQANQGTIFLDEIGEIPHSMQVALLRVLQERKVTPVGGTKEIPLDIRIITATHRDLRQLIREGKFREDLFYRLHVYPIQVPPLRERKVDIPHLVRYFYQAHQWDMNLPLEFFDKLMKHNWPGNIRELWNVLERSHILFQDGMVHTFDWMDSLEAKQELEDPSQADSIGKESASQSDSLTLREKVQKEQIIDALKKTKGNVSLAAQLLGVPRSTFYKRLQKFNL